MKKLILAAGMILAAGAATAQDFSPAVIFDMGGKFDKSFNEAAYNGAEAFKAATGISYGEFEIKQPAQREQALRRLAEGGADIVVATGFAQAGPLEKVAPDYPDTKFVIIDGVVDLPNVKSIIFKEHEGSFLVGALAAMASKSGKVGFVGGMDIPLISKFACGYEQGAKAVNADVEYIGNMTGTTPSAWNDPAKGAELTKGQIDAGVDVVYAAAGGTGIGVYQAAKDGGILAIGVDSNQNYLQPGTMLTSMLKRVDVAVNSSFAAAKDGSWTPGIQVLGLAQGGVGWSLDEHNADLVSSDMKDMVDALAWRIFSGEITVHNYEDTGSCEY